MIVQTRPVRLMELPRLHPRVTAPPQATEVVSDPVDRVDISSPFVHSHNDYLRPHPLQDALSAHANSVEADVHLEDQTTWHWPGLSRLLFHHDLGFHTEKRLLVGHSYEAAATHHEDVEQMYLRPLQEKIDANGGTLPGGPLTLMIELKSGDRGDADPLTTYQHVKPLLEKYRGMLTHYDRGQEVPGQVSVVITGAGLDPVRADMQKAGVRDAALDGGLGDLGAHTAPTLTPQVSANWHDVFHWNGKGTMPEREREHLRALTAQGRQEGIRVRFWDAPDNPAAWQELVEAGAEVNTDKPIQFRQWYDRWHSTS